ncbi:MAG: hypothetical protein HYZ11_16955 [Candidatus Tectomicrobia bacterium]|uniref:GIY-YIG nuclease family protein n=1 Tax=Tectimicrobiota bacterium TaxID=2528274 RepID=A0A932I0U9_UNCTE|nr:hypothetical protein [Candidatus Tectomicrobia bacterium]
MNRCTRVTFSGSSGADYQFEVYPVSAIFNDFGAVYMFTNRTAAPDGTGQHMAVFIGESEELGSRLAKHDLLQSAGRHKFNCVCVHREADEDLRVVAEADLRKRYKPKGNSFSFLQNGH